MTGFLLGEKGMPDRITRTTNHENVRQYYEQKQPIRSLLTITLIKRDAPRQKARNCNDSVRLRFVVRLAKEPAAGRSNVAGGGNVVAGATGFQPMGLNSWGVGWF